MARPKSFAIAALLLLPPLAFATPAEATGPNPAIDGQVLAADRLGAVRVGMREEQLTALGLALADEPTPDGQTTDFLACHRSRINGSAVVVMFEDLVMTRIELDDDSIATAAGARIGTPEAQLRRLYGRSLVRVGADGPPTRYTVTSTDRRHALVFEVHDGKVNALRAGLPDAAMHGEGCR
ncbi:hypothetical protein [Montanilutibacter psychrotolerans]|uniref:Uncharacterized protein n=1 Tax=Montanilutibacter psychrotolerans TaxID=1327343 RepID=A0A3M8SLS3_9GAMM|nr:hypothetical protein [Lysobacter psychrotolerans]RNF82261.1 hypothetical protein EER27_15225 [Lysobacter psychrotolerans]